MPNYIIIPATPGWYLARLFEMTGGGWASASCSIDCLTHADLAPIIAWQINTTKPDYGIVPITTGGPWAEHGRWGYRQPDGKYDFEGQVFDTEAEVFEGLRNAEPCEAKQESPRADDGPGASD